MCVDLRCQFILWYTKVDLWTLNPIIYKPTTQQRQKEHWPDSLVDGSSLRVKKCAKKQQKWKWLDVSAGELSHQRESQNHSSHSHREIALTQQNLNNVHVWEKKNACVHVHSEFQLMKWLLRVWPLSVSRDGCYHCFFFICFEWKPVIRLGWVASYMVLPEQMYDFSFVCERGRGYVSDTEKTSNRSCGPCQLAAQFCVMQENTQSFHLDRE